MEFENGKLYVQYLGERHEVLGVDEDQEFVYLEEVETGIIVLMKHKLFKEKFVKS